MTWQSSERIEIICWMKIWRPWWRFLSPLHCARFVSRYHFQSRRNWNYKSLSVAKKSNKGDWSFLPLCKTVQQDQIRKNSPDDEHFIVFGPDVLFCFVIVLCFIFCTIFFLSPTLFSDRTVPSNCANLTFTPGSLTGYL